MSTHEKVRLYENRMFVYDLILVSSERQLSTWRTYQNNIETQTSECTTALLYWVTVYLTVYWLGPFESSRFTGRVVHHYPNPNQSNEVMERRL